MIKKSANVGDVAERFPDEIAGYPIPHYLAWLEDFERVTHADLDGLSDEQLRREKAGAQRALAAARGRRLYVEYPTRVLFQVADEWLTGRVEAITIEEARRKGGAD